MSSRIFPLGANGQASGSTLVITLGADVPAGSVIFLVVAQGTLNWTTGGSMADSSSNSYTQISHANQNGGTNNGFGAIWYAWNVTALSAGDTITWTVQANTSPSAMQAICATSVLYSSDPLDSAVTASNTGSGTTPTVTSGTPAEANELFIGIYTSAGNGNTFYKPDLTNGWSRLIGSVGAGPANLVAGCLLNGAAQDNSGTGTITFAPTVSANSFYAAFIVGLKSGEGGKRITYPRGGLQGIDEGIFP